MVSLLDLIVDIEIDFPYLPEEDFVDTARKWFTTDSQNCTMLPENIYIDIYLSEPVFVSEITLFKTPNTSG